MKIFLSWSGERSRLIAEALKKWVVYDGAMEISVLIRYHIPFFVSSLMEKEDSDGTRF